MTLDCGGDVLGGLESVFSLVARVFQPGDVEIIAARGDLSAGETTEAAALTLILAFCFSVWIAAERSNEIREIRFLERICLAIGRRAGTSIVMRREKLLGAGYDLPRGTELVSHRRGFQRTHAVVRSDLLK